MRRLKRSGIRMCCVGKLKGTIRQTWTPLGWYLVHKNDGIKVGATYKATDEKIAKVDGLFQQQMKVLIYEKQLMKRLRDGMQV